MYVFTSGFIRRKTNVRVGWIAKMISLTYPGHVLQGFTMNMNILRGKYIAMKTKQPERSR